MWIEVLSGRSRKQQRSSGLFTNFVSRRKFVYLAESAEVDLCDCESSLLPQVCVLLLYWKFGIFSPVCYFVSHHGCMDSMLIRKGLMNDGDNIHALP